MPVKVTRKGRVTIPKMVRDQPGSKVVFEVDQDGVFLRRVEKRALKPSRSERIRGTATSSMTTEEIMALTRGAE
jgi:antitoxin PrlF